MRRFVLLLASLAVAVLLAGGVASAALSNLADAGTVDADGQVRAILEVGDRVYLGGDFTHINGVARNHLAAINATTGELTNWNPNANGGVRTLAASPDGTRLYVGGAFTNVGGASRSRLAALDAATGALDTTWQPGAANATVRAIAVSGSRVYVGGDFTALKGQSRQRLALVDGATGALDPSWLPAANANVRTLALSPTGARLFAGGEFTAVSGQSRPYLASLDAANTGALDTTFRPPSPNGMVWDLTRSGGRVYSAEGGPGGQAAAYDTTTGARYWTYSADGDVQAVSVLSGKVYVAGHFESFAGRARRVFAAVDATTGALDPNWTPTADPAFPGVWVLSTSGLFPRIYTGGDFTRVTGQPHLRFAQFTDSSVTSVDTTAPETTMNSGPSGTITVAEATFAFSSEVGATFECSLDGAPYSACASPKSYTNLSNGSHTFDVRAKDGAGNVDATPASRTFTVDAPPPPQDTTAPETTIDSGPSGTVRKKSATFTFSSSEANSAFECKLDDAAFGACSSPKEYTEVDNGSHTFQVRAIDPAGNTDATPASRTWAVHR